MWSGWTNGGDQLEAGKGISIYKPTCGICWALAFLLTSNSSSLAEDGLAGPSVTLVEENDMVVHTDRHYTQGLKLIYAASEQPADSEGWVARTGRWLPQTGFEPETVRWGVSLGQNIYTPSDISATTLLENDRPYAGFLYTSFFIQRRTILTEHLAQMDHWQAVVGVIGAPSLAEEAQNTVHRLRDIGQAQGWKYQLKTEPGIALQYERCWLVSSGQARGWEAQVLPYGGASLGNVGTYGAAGGQVRAGWHIPGGGGVNTIDTIVPLSGGMPQDGSGHCFGFYFFGGVEGRAVGYNTFLDGNIFQDSHHVTKYPLVGDLKFGGAFTFKYVDLVYTQTLRTKEYVGQPDTDSFGSLALRVNW
jgi:lipid A 3-O-deacylase